MNGRTVRKILMRGRAGTFYGSRALFVVRVPLAAIPEPVPPFTAPGESSYEGCWTKTNEDGTKTIFSIAEIHGRREPTSERRRKAGFAPIIHFAECISSETDEDGDEDDRWVWYEGTELLLGAKEDSAQLAPVIARKNLPMELVVAYVTRRRWIKKYGTGDTPDWTGIEWIDELHRASTYAKRFQPLLHSGHGLMDFAYFVKWRQPRMKLWFCSQMSRALKAAKRAGVAVRVLRPPRR